MAPNEITSDAFRKDTIENSSKAAANIATDTRPPQAPFQLLGFDDAKPIWYLLKAFGIDPARAAVEGLRDDWGSVRVAAHGVFNLGSDNAAADSDIPSTNRAGRELKQAVLESAYAVFESRRIRERLNFQGITEEAGLEYLYLLTDKLIPQALVWALPGSFFDSLFFYPLRHQDQKALWGVAATSNESDDGSCKFACDTSKIEDLLRSLYREEGATCRGNIPESHLGMGQPGGLVRSFSNGIAFPTVFTLEHESSRTMIEVLDKLINDQVVQIQGQKVSEVGCGAGWIAAQMALRGAASVHAYDLNLLKAANAAATARMCGVDDRFYAYCSLSPDVLPESALYLWNIPNFEQSSSKQGEPTNVSRVMNQCDSIAANNLILAGVAKDVIDQLAKRAAKDSLFLVRINTGDKDRFGELITGSQWDVDNASTSLPSDPQKGGAFYLLRRR